MNDCKHEWYITDKTQQGKSLMVKCHKCEMFGFVEDPTKDEWRAADKAESEPYLWNDNSRVKIWPGGQ